VPLFLKIKREKKRSFGLKSADYHGRPDVGYSIF